MYKYVCVNMYKYVYLSISLNYKIKILFCNFYDILTQRLFTIWQIRLVAFYDICNNNIILQNNVLYIIRHRRCIDFQYMYRYDKWMVCRFSSVLYANVIDTYSIWTSSSPLPLSHECYMVLLIFSIIFHR